MSKVVKTQDRNERLREASGKVILADSLATFFYLLMRDHVPAGKVEMVVREVLESSEECIFSNGFLAQYAANLADELRDGRLNALTNALDAAFTDHTRMGTPPKTPEADFPGKLEITAETKEKIDAGYDKLSEEEKAKAEYEFETGKSVEVEQMTEKMTQVFEQEEVEAEAEVETESRPQGRTSMAHSMAIDASLKAVERLKELVPSETVNEVAKILKQEVEAELDAQAEKKLPKGSFRRVATDLAVDDEDIIYTERN